MAALAYGEKRRLEIALALAGSPSLLLLDEPLAGMSPAERVETVQLLKNIRHGRTLIVVEHDMEALFELAERITVLHEGARPRRRHAGRNPAQQLGPGSLSRRGGGGVSALLEVDRINSYYGDSHILFDVSLRVERNEVVALLGRNGAGKSTTLKSLIGVVRPRSGRIALDGMPTQGLPPHAIAALGLQLVPEDRRIFGSLSVEDNLVLAGLTAKPRWPLERVWETFPAAARAPAQSRHRPLGRRAADAGDCPRVGPRAEDHVARRAVRGAGADHRARPARHLPRARRGRTDDRRWSSRTSRRR